ncbi:hypothetical protein C2845_PM03G15710 [Panicum miliaceum]|uniref:Uncharacterized protein n=1 Tax=Panicum miliaceum TaxID=4540 RepID=A0A3L6TBP7_PANMI|nr:hypothetical protein C2845_PM03G15710 [Panicum miliaceum]
MRCLVVSPALCAASTTARPPGTLAISPPVAGGRARFPRLRLELRPGETLRHRCLAARAQNQNHGRSRNAQPRVETNYFLEEENRHILSRFVKINGSPERYLFYEAMSAHVCISARKAVTMASQIVDSACLTTGTTPSSGISKDTIHITLGAYVDVFVQTAEDSCNRKVCDKTVMLFLDALTGLASISHILLEAALEALSHTHPRESLAE